MIIIGIDGCRSDALIAANTPNIDKLIENGSFTPIAQTRPVTSSGPGWSNMLTGVWQDKHGVKDNSFSNDNYEDYPHFFNRIKAKDPSMHCASIVRWEPIQSRMPKIADLDLAITSSDKDVASAAVDYIQNTDDLDVLFVQIDDVDHAGHQYGYDPESPNYLEAIEKIDALIGQIIASVNQRRNILNENWLIIVSTDHGGIGKSHGGGSKGERAILLIVSGESAEKIRIDDVEANTKNQDIGKSIVLDGEGFGKVENTSLDLSAFEDFTIEVMVKSNGWNGDPAIVSDKNWDSGKNKGFVLAGKSDGVTWKFNLGNGTNRIDLNGGDISDGKWHHIAVVFDRDGRKALFQDGELISSTNQILPDTYSSSLDFGVGQDGTLSYNYTFRGEIGDIKIWSKPLSQEVIYDNFCQSLSRHPELNFLQAHWSFEKLDENDIDDVSSNNHKLTITGNLKISSGTNSIECFENRVTPNIVDVAITALTHMGISIDPGWQLDGIPFGLKTSEENSGKDYIYQFANPNNGNFEIAVPTNESLIFHISVNNLSGKIILPSHIQHGKSAFIDMSFYASGIYLITIQTIFGTEKRKFVLNND